MRIGLVGLGRIGQIHARNLRALPAVDSILVADADPVRARQVTGAEAVTVDELFAAKLDGLVIATPTSTHAELCIAAAAAAVPVFCEKPIAAHPAEARRVLASVAAAGVPLQVGFQRRFDPGFAAVRDAVRAGELGWLHIVRACTSDSRPPPPEFLPTSGGIFRDLCLHDFDSIRWVTGREVVGVYATGANRGAAFFAAAGDVDSAAVLLTLDDGTLAACTATRYNGAGLDVRLEVSGSLATRVAGLDQRTPISLAIPPGPDGMREPYRDFADRFRVAYAAELAAFLEVAAGRIPSPCPGEDALAAQLVAEAADESHRTGRPVSVAEVSARTT